MKKVSKLAKVIICVVLACVIGAGAYVGNMLGYFNGGNAHKYSVAKSEKISSSLDGKTIIFLGSSVTKGYAAKGESFVDYLEKMDGVNAIKVAKSGTTLVNNGHSSYVSRMKRIDKDIKADAFVCQLSTNDATKKKPLGEVSDSKNMDDFDTKTVAGAIEYIIAYAKETWDCPVIFYTSARYESQQYEDMIVLLLQIQEKWGIDVIDLWNSVELTNPNPALAGKYMVDDIHPTRLGYKEWWLPVIREYLKIYVK